MQTTRCKKCGRPLRDPESIARGMGPECAGSTGGRKKYRSRRQVHRGSAYSLGFTGVASPTLFTLVQNEEQAEVLPAPGSTVSASDAQREEAEWLFN
ncbi:MAG: DUF6011 domain-containing protein [Syntrophothermus sp.]